MLQLLSLQNLNVWQLTKFWCLDTVSYALAQKGETVRVNLHLIALEIFQLQIIPAGRLKWYYHTEA